MPARENRPFDRPWHAYDTAKRGLLMDPIGFEPMTSCMPCKRAPNCATGPKNGV
jgi:hypothetical protein